MPRDAFARIALVVSLSIGIAAATHTLTNVPALSERDIAGSAPELRCLDDRLMDRGADDEVRDEDRE